MSSQARPCYCERSFSINNRTIKTGTFLFWCLDNKASMGAETESCNDKAKEVRGLGLRLSEKHLPSFERLENLTVSCKQKVSRKGLRLANRISNNLTAQHNTQGLGYEGEISRWSSDSSESNYEK